MVLVFPYKYVFRFPRLHIYSRISPPPAGDILRCNEALLVPGIAISDTLGSDLVGPDDESSSPAVAPEN